MHGARQQKKKKSPKTKFTIHLLCVYLTYATRGIFFYLSLVSIQPIKTHGPLTKKLVCSPLLARPNGVVRDLNILLPQQNFVTDYRQDYLTSVATYL